MPTERDTHWAIARWYALRQIPVRERLADLVAEYSPRPGEGMEAVIARMPAGDQAEALDLAAEISPYFDCMRRAVAARTVLAPKP